MKILHLEDNPGDAMLVRDLLASDWPVCDFTLVATREAFVAALDEGGFDLVLSDFQLPAFNGLEALELVRQRAPHVPFIFFTGTMGEERAIEAVRAGAADFVVKDRVQRLPVAIQRALREVEELRERREIEDALAQEQYLMLMLMENLPDQVYFKDLESRFITFSRSIARRHRLAPFELKGKTDFDLFTEEHARQSFEDEQRIIRTGQPLVQYEEKETWPDGTVTWALSTKLPFRDAAGKIVGTFGISHDITARKQAEERIREQAEIIDHAPVAVVITDLTHRITYCNESACELYGRPRDQLLGCTAEDVFTAETVAQLAAGRTATLERGSWSGELSLVARKTGERMQAEFYMSVIRDSAGQPKARLSIAIDVTEKNRLEAQFLRAQRLESLGMLAAGIAHDLNNVLAPVLMGAPLLRVRASHPSDLRVLETIESSAGRGAALVRQILSFAHGASGEKTLIQIKHLMRDITGLIEETFPKNIRLDDHIPNNLWTVLGNPTQIHQVLLNLCVNARDAMPLGGTLQLHAENRLMDAAALREFPEASPGPYIMLEVADTGSGISADVLPHIWEPFFTTKAEGKGTGLGLVTVRGIATSHGGFASVESTPGQGSIFRVFLPAAEATHAGGPAAGSSSSFPIRGKGELVLVVDDEINIRELITAILSRSGYRVLTAAHGLEAMEIYAPRVGEIALVISDLSMPMMGGEELALALSRLKPDVKLLYISGAGEKEGTQLPLPASATVLIKPFTADRLLASVRDALQPPVVMA